MDKKRMKKIIIFMFAAAFIFVSGCSASEDISENAGGGISGDGAPETRYTAAEIASAVLSGAEFPKMTELSPEEMESYIGFDSSYAEDVSFHWQAISVELAEVLIILPKEGMEDEARAFAEARYEKIKNDTAFYPSQELAADAAVVGEKDGVIYYICSYGAAEAEEALTGFIGGAP